MFQDMREVHRNLSELLATDTAEEEAASLKIASSASRFSRRARVTVDDKLTFSATLMRAGEVTAATRLLAEVEEEVRNEEIALIETVNEVKVAQAVRRGRITRLRLARSFAVAMLGACLLAFSAVGMAVAGALDERGQKTPLAPLRIAGSGQQDAPGASPTRSVQNLMRRLKIGDVKLLLTAGEFRRLTQLTGGNIQDADLDDVVGMLQGTLAQKVEDAIDAASATVDKATSTLSVEQVPAIRKATRLRKKAAKAAGTSEQQQETQREEEQPANEPQPEPSPEPEPEPEPSPSEGDEGGGGNGEEGGTVINPLPEGE